MQKILIFTVSTPSACSQRRSCFCTVRSLLPVRCEALTFSHRFLKLLVSPIYFSVATDVIM